MTEGVFRVVVPRDESAFETGHFAITIPRRSSSVHRQFGGASREKLVRNNFGQQERFEEMESLCRRPRLEPSAKRSNVVVVIHLREYCICGGSCGR